jgi:hypothetical protein
MDSLIDYTQSPQEILTAMINRENGTTLLAEQLVFGLPQVSIGPTNTTVTCSGAAGSGFTGTVTLNYNRIAMSSVPGTRTKTFTAGNAVLISALLPLINELYAINLRSSDILDGPLPLFEGLTPGEVKPFTLTVTTSCLVYQGSVNLYIRRRDIDLPTVVSATVLD